MTEETKEKEVALVTPRNWPCVHPLTRPTCQDWGLGQAGGENGGGFLLEPPSWAHWVPTLLHRHHFRVPRPWSSVAPTFSG